MKNKLSNSRFKYLPTALGLTFIMGISNPAWSVGDKEPSLGKKEEKEIGMRKEKNLDRDKSAVKAREKEDRGRGSVKKKIVRGGGAAIVTGVASKKVAPSIKRD